MKKLSSKLWALPMAVMLAVPTFAVASESSAITLTLQNTGVDADASGRVVSSLKSSSSVFGVVVSKLDASKTYAVQIGDVVEGQFTTDKKGSGKLSFKTKSSTNPLDFDPRGQTLQIHDGVATVLQAVISGAGEPEGIVVDERVLLAPTNSSDSIKGKAEYRSRKNGQRSFKVQVERVSGSGFELFVDGVKRGDLRSSGREAKIEFSTSPRKNELLLDFDPRGQVIDVMQAGAIRATGTLLARAQNVNVATPSIQSFNLPSTGADDNGTAKARLRVRENARKDFSVEIEDVPAGAYKLYIGGTIRGTISAATTTSGVKGEIEFSYGDDNPKGELPLNFEPRGQLIEIKNSNGDTIFSRLFGNGSAPSGTGNTGGTGNAATPMEVKLPLISTGADSDALAEAKFRRKDNGDEDFEVEVEDVNVGAYELVVGGIVRATIDVVSVPGGTRGKVEFDSDSPKAGELLLDFAVAGQEVIVRQGSTVYFSRVIPAN